MAKDPKRWDDVIIQSPYATLTKKDVHEYLTSPKIKKAILAAVGNREAVIRQSFDKDRTVLRRKDPKGKYIRLNPERYEAWAAKRLTEVHPTFGKRVRTLVADIDPKPGVPWKRVRGITETVAKTIGGHPDVESVGIQYSGGDGFYVLGQIREPIHVDTARHLTQKLLGNLANRDDVTLGVAEPGNIRLDTTPLHVRGSIRAPYSLNAETGLVAAPIKMEDLATVKKTDFTVNKILKTAAHKKKKEFAPGIPMARAIRKIPTVKKPNPTWMLAIQDHDAKKAGRHFDLRLGQPLTNYSHSWAIPKARLPDKKDKFLLAVQQPTHTRDYAEHFTGTLPTGYGAGTVKMPIKEPITVTKATDDKIHFERKDDKGKYVLFRTKGNNWGFKKLSEDQCASKTIEEWKKKKRQQKDDGSAFIRMKMR